MAELSTTLDGPSLKVVLQATIHPLIQINIHPVPKIPLEEKKGSKLKKILSKGCHTTMGSKNDNDATKIRKAMMLLKLERNLLAKSHKQKPSKYWSKLEMSYIVKHI